MANVINVRTVQAGGPSASEGNKSAGAAAQDFAKFLTDDTSAETSAATVASPGKAGATGSSFGLLTQTQSSDSGKTDDTATATQNGGSPTDTASATNSTTNTTHPTETDEAALVIPATKPETPNATQTIILQTVSAMLPANEETAAGETATDEDADETDGTSASDTTSTDTNAATAQDAATVDASIQALLTAMPMAIQPVSATPQTPADASDTAEDEDLSAVSDAAAATSVTNDTANTQKTAATAQNVLFDATKGPLTGTVDMAAATADEDQNGTDALPSERAKDQNGGRPSSAKADADSTLQTSPQTSASASTASTTTGTATAYPYAAAVQPSDMTADSQIHMKYVVSSAAGNDNDVAASSLDMLGLTITAKTAAGQKNFTIQITPPELGRVEVKLSVDDSGHGHAVMIVDKPQTLTLLQQDASHLNNALADAGINLAGGGLNFSLRGQEKQYADQQTSSGNDLRVDAIVDDTGLDGASGRQSYLYDYGFGTVRLDISV